MRKPLFASLAVGLVLAVTLGQSGCGTSTGNPVVTIDMDSYSSRNFWLEQLIPSAYAAVSQVKLCFKRVRFKPLGKPTNEDVTSDEDNQDFNVGEKTLSVNGSNLGSVTVAAGTYRRIEFDFDDHCGFGASVYLINSSGGPYLTNDTISMKFEETFTITEDSTVALNPQLIIGELDGVTSGSEIKSKMLAKSGTIRKK
ncbi:MAG: hypothetical protein NDJ89_00050 [Oligoflexia bacterium]|nr:hypothetical protein [Oligoflexia bacterium]